MIDIAISTRNKTTDILSFTCPYCNSFNVSTRRITCTECLKIIPDIQKIIEHEQRRVLFHNDYKRNV